jgi:MtN3 and saliva related transmembrane protein
MENVIEFFFGISLFINAVLFIPQIARLIISKDAREISFITFFGFCFIQLITVLHGVIRKDYLLAIGTSLSLITCGFVVILIIYYRLKNKK